MLTLPEFLQKYKEEILEVTEGKARELAGAHPSSDLLKKGLPIFLEQVTEVISRAGSVSNRPPKNVERIADAADRCDEPAMAEAAGQPQEAELAKTAGKHGIELLRLGYTLSHVVHAYGAICQSITELASKKKVAITATEFHALNRCLDVAIAGAVTEFQLLRDSEDADLKSELNIPEMRRTLTSVIVAFQAVQSGSVGVGGGTGRMIVQLLEKLKNLFEKNYPESLESQLPKKQ